MKFKDYLASLVYTNGAVFKVGKETIKQTTDGIHIFTKTLEQPKASSIIGYKKKVQPQ